MSFSRRTLLISAVAAAVASAIPGRLLAAPLINGPGDSADRRFSLLYKGHTIGRHVVRSVPAIEDLRVSTEIEVTVKRLFFTVFSYSHRSEERWRDGRLMALKSQTTEGGQTLSVDGAVVAKGFRVVGKEGPFIAPPAALTSNCLWNAAILQQEAVIDAQHGGVIGLSVRQLAGEDIVIAGRLMAARRFRFITPDLAGTLWYDDAGRWVSGALERDGATLQYRLEA
jgi:Family of unknown function (DUF6134)